MYFGIKNAFFWLFRDVIGQREKIMRKCLKLRELKISCVITAVVFFNSNYAFKKNKPFSNDMNTIRFAGGIKNPFATSYLNCILQIILRYEPFADLINSFDNNEQDIIMYLNQVFQGIKTTKNYISIDNLIDFLKIDRKEFQNIKTFYLNFFDQMPEFCTSFIDYKNFEFDSTIDFHNEVSIKSLVENKFITPEIRMIFIHFNIDSAKMSSPKLDQEISILGKKFYLYSFVQMIGTPIRCSYVVTFRDYSGWIRANDTSLIAVENDSIDSILNESKMPVELAVYLDEMKLFNLDRREFEDNEIHIVQNNSNNIKCISSSDEVEEVDAPNKQLKVIFFDWSKMEIVNEHMVDMETFSYNYTDAIHYEMTEYFGKNLEYFGKNLEYTLYKGDMEVGHIEDRYDGKMGIPMISFRLFDSNKIDIPKFMRSQKYDCSFHIRDLNRSFQVKFLSEQKVKHIKIFAKKLMQKMLPFSSDLQITIKCGNKIYNSGDNVTISALYQNSLPSGIITIEIDNII